MAIDFTALGNEIKLNPAGLPYAGKKDDQIADILNTPNRQTNRESLDAGSLIASIVRSEFAALAAADKQYVQLIAMAQTMPLTATLKTELGAVFPANSATRTNLVALMKRPGTRAEELNLGGSPTASDVAEAKRLVP